jgi:hypothetical protein
MGSGPAVPENARISAAVGPPATKVRPSWPRVSQPISEPGPPERSALSGCSTPSAVP